MSGGMEVTLQYLARVSVPSNIYLLGINTSDRSIVCWTRRYVDDSASFTSAAGR
jgi:hypothetical protein